MASAGAPLPVASGKPSTRCTEAASPLAAPVARCSSLRSVASRPARSRLRLVNRSRLPLCSARRLRSEDSVIQFRLACAPRYVAYIRGPITPGQGVFSNPQGYPRKFPPIPRNSGVVHRSCTGKSPDLRPTGSDFVDGTAAFRLNGADGTTPGHGRDHYVEHVSPRARQAARGRLFCCPGTGTDR